MIIGGLGLAIMPDFVCPKSDEIILRPFDLPAQLEFGIICRNNDNSALVRTFIDVAREEYRSLQK
jgi:LysR substrate binding domain.